MIISKVLGGLGNQMFQYAAGRALALERGLPFRLDLSGFAGYGLHHGFLLQQVFDCPVEAAKEADVRSILGWQHPAVIRRLAARPQLAALRRKGFVVEPYFHYWPGIKSVPDESYLSGYWQSERYFRDVISQIRKDFSFKAPLTGMNAELSDRIAASDAVSLHVRRGDYVSDNKNKAVYGHCSLDYYRAAINYLADRVAQPTLFIFSDDPGWVKDNLKLDFSCHYVDHNQGIESYNDMHLMSLCKHHVIANSSFSWWGAWLNSNPEKIVIAPANWFVNGNSTKDLILPGWISL
ncbi:MAG: alpha-1,2-fucosyltransferase [Gallionella sp.]|nr:alpha-1,2-fucosyltransferase [Gallionella sp.]MDD4947112.1 alpha-1,2-fucosyltransferase [Gallionella sp.]MDD5611454.1 alpha-1,2-fucosyltransferase [Gallionella sp.]